MELSRIGLGLFAAGGGYGALDKAQAARTIDAAIEHGWAFLDTAEAYGDTEALLGELLAHRRSRVFIGTKAFPCEPYTARNLQRAVVASLRRMRTDYIDLYQLHGPERWTMASPTPLEEVACALGELQRNGYVRRVGVCNFGTDEIAALAQHVTLYSAQYLYNMIDRAPNGDPFQYAIEDEVLPSLLTAGVRFIAYSPLARGLLANSLGAGRSFPGDDERHYLPRFEPGTYRHFVSLSRDLEAWAREHGCGLPTLAVAWALRDSRVSCVLVGAKTAQQVADVAPAARWQLAAADITSLGAILDRLPTAAAMAPATLHQISRERLGELTRRRAQAVVGSGTFELCEREQMWN